MSTTAAAIERGLEPLAMRLMLPWPPTVNHSTRPNGRGGRYLTDEHKVFRLLVLNAATKAGARKKLKGRISVSIIAIPPDARQRDLDNIVKGLLDSLQAAAVFENDNQVDHIEISRVRGPQKGTVFVTVREIGT